MGDIEKQCGRMRKDSSAKGDICIFTLCDLKLPGNHVMSYT